MASDSELRKPAPEKIHVELGKITVTEGLSKKAVKKLLQQHIHSIRLCYKQASKKGSHPQGKAVFTLTVDPGGQAIKVRVVRSGVKGKELEQCIIQKLRQLAFPAPHGGKAVTLTVTFHIK